MQYREMTLAEILSEADAAGVGDDARAWFAEGGPSSSGVVPSFAACAAAEAHIEALKAKHGGLHPEFAWRQWEAAFAAAGGGVGPVRRLVA